VEVKTPHEFEENFYQNLREIQAKRAD